MNITPSRFASLLPRIRAGLAAALGRFPWMLLCGLAGTVSAMVLIEQNDHQAGKGVADWCLKIGMTAMLGMPLFFSLRILRERAVRLGRWPLETLGLPLLAVWMMTLPHRVADGPEIVVIRWALLLAALHFFAAVSGYIRGREENGMWQFNRRIFVRFCLTTLYTGVLTAGLELALLSADKLFGWNVGNSYGHLFFLIVGCFHPAFFLAGVPRDFAALELDTEHPRGLKVFTQFALAPLVGVYTAILYAYALKIVAGHTWPHGWVALPVLILSGVGIFAELLLHPLRMRPDEKWAGWYCRNFPRALAPLSLLLLLSVRERISAYGVTEERYLGIVSGGWILAWALVYVFKRTAGIRWVPASLAVICLAAAYGPWSAGTISRNSQYHRVIDLLQANGLLVGGQIKVPEKAISLPGKDYDVLRESIHYLISKHGSHTLYGVLGGTLKKDEWDDLDKWSSGEEILKALNLKDGSTGESEVFADYALDPTAGPSVEGFKRVFLFKDLYDTPWSFGKRPEGGLFLGVDAGVLKSAVRADEPPQPVPLDAFLKSLPEKSQSSMAPSQMTVDWERDGRSFRIIFTQIAFRNFRNEPLHISNCTFLLLEK